MYGVYIHAPWCKRRCPYCAFNIYIDKNPPFKKWEELVVRDWNWAKQHWPTKPGTIYFGGGTPSLIPPDIIGSIITVINPRATEITIETNPEDITTDIISQYKTIGITRLSVGIQSFNKRFERILGRGSSIQQAHNAIHLIQQAQFASWSLDVMFGLPNQTIQELMKDLQTIIDIRPPHVSLYNLTYEPGTAFKNALERGVLKEPKEDTWIEMFYEIVQSLEEAGYEQYEISNFSLPDHRSKHNNAIWRNGHYAGLGPGSHGFLPDGRRTINPPNWNEWLCSAIPIIETPTKEQHVIDAILTWIRHKEGISIPTIEQMGYRFSNHLLKTMISNEFLLAKGDTILLGKKGLSVVDLITRRLVQDLTPIN
jgi:oxygen-independent coproporphyrinogen III oxidase